MVSVPQLTDDEWRESLEILTAYAGDRIGRCRWQGKFLHRGGVAPEGIEAGDLAASSILDVIEGRRKWTGHTEFCDFLRSVVDSKLSNLLNGKSAAESRLETDTPPELTLDTLDALATEEWRKKIAERILAAFENDQVARDVFSCVDAGMTKPQEIAVHLDIPLRDVNNAKKRLRRVADAVLPEGAGE